MNFVCCQIDLVEAFLLILLHKDVHILKLHRLQKQDSMICLQFTTKVIIRVGLPLHA